MTAQHTDGGAIRTVGVFGAGRFGSAIARRALAAGFHVQVASAGGVQRTAEMLDRVAPGALPSSPATLAERADVLVLAVPLHRFAELPLGSIAGRTVIDAMNYWPPVDGDLPDFRSAPTSVVVRDALGPGTKLGKAFNHLSHRQLDERGRAAGSPDRAAVGICADELEALRTASLLVDRLGFDPVPAGPLNASSALEPGSPVFGALHDASTLRRLLAAHRSDAA